METIVHNAVHVAPGARLAAAAPGRHRQDQGPVRRPGRAAGVAAVLRPHQALPERLGLQHDDDLGVPGRAGGRPGDGGDRGAVDSAGTDATAPISFTGDLILLAYLLGLGRFFTASAALDTGSAFEGMGAAREVTFACLAEPAFFLGLLVLAKLSGSLQLAGMLGSSLAAALDDGRGLARPGPAQLVHRPAGGELADPLRRPEHAPGADHDPRSHGPRPQRPGLRHDPLRGGAQAVRLRRADRSPGLPLATGSAWLDWPIFVGGMLVVAVVIGVVESTMARLRLTHVPVLLVAACLLSAFGVILLVR